MPVFLEWIICALVLFGLTMTTVAVVGMYRLPGIYMRLHAASKTALIGAGPVLIGLALLGDGPIAGRALLIGVFLIITTPVAAHVIAQTAFEHRAPLSPGGKDESGRYDDRA